MSASELRPIDTDLEAYAAALRLYVQAEHEPSEVWQLHYLGHRLAGSSLKLRRRLAAKIAKQAAQLAA